MPAFMVNLHCSLTLTIITQPYHPFGVRECGEFGLLEKLLLSFFLGCNRCSQPLRINERSLITIFMAQLLIPFGYVQHRMIKKPYQLERDFNNLIEIEG
jgi:hypothetical protein